MNSKLSALIGKYTLLLALTYAIEFGATLLLKHFDIEVQSVSRIWIKLIPAILSISFNIVTAIILYSDIVKTGIHARYAILGGLLFRPVGVCAFLIYVIIHNKHESTQEPIDGILDR